MANEDLVFTLAWTDIDPAVLAGDGQQPGSDAFRRGITHFLQKQYEPFGGKIRVVFNDAAQTVAVTWTKPGSVQTVTQKALEALNRRDFAAAVLLFKAMLAKSPDDSTLLYNLGMVYSDQGQLDNAAACLRRAVALDPTHAHAVVALGVVNARAGDLQDAIETLEDAVRLDPSNTFAHQNLGACLLKSGDFQKAEQHFRMSLRTDPSNLQSQLGLAQTLESDERHSEADEIYQEIIRLAGHSPAGSFAKEGRTRIAHALLRAASDERPDVVMYCLGALERFQEMTEQQIASLGREIAILGMKGLDINDPERKYTLKSLPGQFSGLHLVSIMYTAFHKTSPGTDVGIDLSREYAQAEAMLEAR